MHKVPPRLAPRLEPRLVLRPALMLVPLLPLRVTPRLVPLLVRRAKMLPATGRCLTLLRPTKPLSPVSLIKPVSLPRRHRAMDKYPRVMASQYNRRLTPT